MNNVSHSVIGPLSRLASEISTAASRRGSAWATSSLRALRVAGLRISEIQSEKDVVLAVILLHEIYSLIATNAGVQQVRLKFKKACDLSSPDCWSDAMLHEKVAMFFHQRGNTLEAQNVLARLEDRLGTKWKNSSCLRKCQSILRQALRVIKKPAD